MNGNSSRVEDNAMVATQSQCRNHTTDEHDCVELGHRNSGQENNISQVHSRMPMKVT